MPAKFFMGYFMCMRVLGKMAFKACAWVGAALRLCWMPMHSRAAHGRWAVHKFCAQHLGDGGDGWLLGWGRLGCAARAYVTRAAMGCWLRAKAATLAVDCG